MFERKVPRNSAARQRAVGTLNFVKVHDAGGLPGFVLNFLVVMRHKFGDHHAAARQELFDCQVLLHVFPVGFMRKHVPNQ